MADEIGRDGSSKRKKRKGMKTGAEGMNENAYDEDGLDDDDTKSKKGKKPKKKTTKLDL